MNFSVDKVCGRYLVVTVSDKDSGLMGKRESIDLAQSMVSVAEDLLYAAGMRKGSDDCGSIVEDLHEQLSGGGYEYTK